MLKLFTIALILFSSVNLFANTYYIQEMDKATTIELAEAKNAVQELVQNALANQGQQVVSSSEDATYILKPNVLKLGSAYIVSVNKFKDGTLVYSEKMKAKTLDDVDMVCERLVTSIVSEKKVTSTKTVDTVTEDEVKGTTVKTKALKQVFIGFGPGKLNNLGKDDNGINFTAGYLWSLGHQFSLRAAIDHTSAKGSDSRVTNFGVGGQYYLTRNNHSPYALGMFNYMASSFDETGCNTVFFCDSDKEGGFGMKAGLGMQFFRTTTVSFAVEANYSHAFYQIHSKSPGQFAANIIVLW